MRKKYFILLILFILLLKPFLFPLNLKIDNNMVVDLNFRFNAYYLNDQRIQWSGMEATFGSEALMKALIRRDIGGSQIKVFTELRLNQPFDDNRLVDEYRSLYIQNFDTKGFELTRMYIGFSSKHFEFSLGKRETFFGRDNLVHLFNSDFDLPFIRTESILLRETGIFVSYRSGILNLSAAVVNGGPEMDTNSSKAGILRAGIEGKAYSAGISAKFQDGIGSEDQKEFKNHIGVDFMFRSGSIKLSGEFIYDQYGFRKDFDPDRIFWKRSLYNRDIFYKSETPITGFGGYIDLQLRVGRFLLNGNYGEFYPQKIGVASHDEPVRRLIVKSIYHPVESLGLFAGGLLENDRPVETAFEGRSGYAFFLGALYKIN